MSPNQRQLLEFAGASLVALVVVTGAFGSGVFAWVAYHTRNEAAVVSGLPRITLSDTALSAKAATVIDLHSGAVLYQKQAYEALPLASLTKLMSVEVVLSKVPLDTPVTITLADIAPEGDWGLQVGQQVPLGDLIRMSLIASSNDAVAAAASTLGGNPAEALNRGAEELGLAGMRFLNPTGLDASAQSAGAYGSAYDVARLAGLFYRDHADLFELTTRPGVSVTVSGKTLTSEATALPLDSIPGFIGAKTGYTDLAGGNLVAIFDLEPGRPVVVAVLGSTRNGRFEDIKTLVEAARAALAGTNPLP